MKQYYRLSSSMSDRENYDSLCRQCGWDAADALPFEDVKNMDKDDIKNAAEMAWVGAESTDFVEQVDDVEEAKARWLIYWVDGFEMKRDLELEANNSCDCCQE